MEMTFVSILAGLLLYLGRVVSGRDVCNVYGSVYTYCDDGYYCCEDDTQCCANASLSVGAIVGLVIAILFFLALCGVCAMFLVKKHKSRSGQVIRPVQNTQTVAVVGTAPYNMPPQYNQAPGQYPYGQPMQPPPYSQNTPAYPPPQYAS